MPPGKHAKDHGRAKRRARAGVSAPHHRGRLEPGGGQSGQLPGGSGKRL